MNKLIVVVMVMSLLIAEAVHVDNSLRLYSEEIDPPIYWTGMLVFLIEGESDMPKDNQMNDTNRLSLE